MANEVKDPQALDERRGNMTDKSDAIAANKRRVEELCKRANLFLAKGAPWDIKGNVLAFKDQDGAIRAITKREMSPRETIAWLEGYLTDPIA